MSQAMPGLRGEARGLAPEKKGNQKNRGRETKNPSNLALFCERGKLEYNLQPDHTCMPKNSEKKEKSPPSTL